MKSAGASPEKSVNKSPSKESQSSGNKGRMKDTASHTQKKRPTIESYEFSQTTPVKKPLFGQDSDSPRGHMPMKRMHPSDDSSQKRRLSEDLNELAIDEKSTLLIKRQKLDGKPFDLKITRLEMIANSPSKRQKNSATNEKKESRSSGACAENENIGRPQASDKKSCRSNQQTRKIIGVTFE